MLENLSQFEEKDNVPIVIDGPILITMYAGIIRTDGINLIIKTVCS